MKLEINHNELKMILKGLTELAGLSKISGDALTNEHIELVKKLEELR